MPRRNENHVYDRGRARPQGKRGPRVGYVDWDRVDELAGRRSTSTTTTRRTETPPNEFTRRIVGFGEKTLELMLAYGFENVNEKGFVPVRFSGISQAPVKEMPYKKPSLAKTRGGIIVLTGIVDGPNLNEIGHGTSPIRQADVPVLDSHTAPTRLNVALGREPKGFKENELARALTADAPLTIAGVDTVNGSAIRPWATASEISQHWHLAPKPYEHGSRW